MKDTKKALKWIVSILDTLEIPWFISGGFACKLYGTMRPLADIDIGVPVNKLKELNDLLKEHVVDNLERYKDACWDLDLVTIEYEGQIIDIFGPETANIFDKVKGEWVKFPYSFTDYTDMLYEGIKVRIQPLNSILYYKNILQREVDTSDINELKL